MFQPLNLFKSIKCPFYSVNSNTLTCERPYCQFKHPRVQTPTSSTQPPTTSNSETVEAPKLTEVTKLVEAPNELEKEKTNLTENLPNILENLSSVLQSVQKLFTTEAAGLSELATTATDPGKISSSLETITSAINSLSSNKSIEHGKTKRKDVHQKSPVPNKLKQEQLNAPVYNPTPKKDLKNMRFMDDSDEEETVVKKRKKNYSDEVLEIIKIEKEEFSDDIQEISPPIKIEKKIPSRPSDSQSKKPLVASKTSSNSVKTSVDNKSSPSDSKTSSKTDMVAFSKLTLSQQVQKRYEMLNKTPPTPMTLAETRLKRIQQSLGGSSKTSLPGKTPASTGLKAPKLIVDNTNKIPLAMRQRYLTVIFDTGRLNFPTLEKACEKAAEQEKSIYDRAKNKLIYTNLAANLVRGLRNTQQSVNSTPGKAGGTMSLKNGVKKPAVQSQSHEAMLCGPQGNRCTYSINRVKQKTLKELSIHDMYKMFMTYVMSEEQLDEHCFPKWMQQTTDTKDKKKLAMIPNFKNKSTTSSAINKKQQTEKQLVKTEPQSLLVKHCKRCNQKFMLLAKDLSYVSSNSECVFHWGKLRNVRVDKAPTQKYFCCNGHSNETGCEVGKHVYEGENDGNGTGLNMTGYVETRQGVSEKCLTSENIYAVDCEMCYTTRGLEVARVSVVDIHMKEVYESLVKPDAQILDYNTRWSGLTEEILITCDKRLRQVQQELLRFFNKDTILIGHSLDSDFKALKLVHKKVVDTSVVFPHKLGLPYKRALRNLMSEYLQKIIQEDVQGHDSKEDAVSCIQLLEWKINEDLKNTKKTASILDPSKANIGTSQFTTAKMKSN